MTTLHEHANRIDDAAEIFEQRAHQAHRRSLRGVLFVGDFAASGSAARCAGEARSLRDIAAIVRADPGQADDARAHLDLAIGIPWRSIPRVDTLVAMELHEPGSGVAAALRAK